jgi:hypothetical protein
MGYHSSFERGMPCPLLLTSMTAKKAFLKAARASPGNDGSVGGARWNTKAGVGQAVDRVGYESRGPPIVTTVPSGCTDVLLSDFCPCCRWRLRRHQLSADSAATLPP